MKGDKYNEYFSIFWGHTRRVIPNPKYTYSKTKNIETRIKSM